MDTSNLNLREIILNLREPHMIRNMKLPWKCFDMSFHDWCQLYDQHLQKNEQTVEKFEYASRMYFDSPQWERYRESISLSFKEFFEKIMSTNKDEFLKENWMGFSYKNIENLPSNCKIGMSFTYFGFSDVDDDITFWLGSDGAHTPCHYDTYGCNIIVQVYGRKMWLLFPPTTNLMPCRIPYEESSVYCSETFYSPKDCSKYEGISADCYKCILEPGDVLLVPNKWWHYVENLTPALSVNCWIPIEKDTETLMEECIVKFIIERVVSDVSEESKIEFLNPNEDLVGEGVVLHLLQHLADEILHKEKEVSNKLNVKKYPYQYLSESEVEKLMKLVSKKIEKVENITKEQFFEILKTNSKRYDEKINKDNTEMNLIKKILLNAFCDPKIIAKV